MTTNAQLRKWLDEWASEGWKLTTKWRDIEYRLPHKTIEKLATFIAIRSAEAERKKIIGKDFCLMFDNERDFKNVIKFERADERKKCMRDFQGMTASQYVQQVRKDERQRTLKEVKEKLEKSKFKAIGSGCECEVCKKFWEELEAR